MVHGWGFVLINEQQERVANLRLIAFHERAYVPMITSEFYVPFVREFLIKEVIYLQIYTQILEDFMDKAHCLAQSGWAPNKPYLPHIWCTLQSIWFFLVDAFSLTDHLKTLWCITRCDSEKSEMDILLLSIWLNKMSVIDLFSGKWDRSHSVGCESWCHKRVTSIFLHSMIIMSVYHVIFGNYSSYNLTGRFESYLILHCHWTWRKMNKQLNKQNKMHSHLHFVFNFLNSDCCGGLLACPR